MVLAIAIMAVLGPKQQNIILALAIVGWPGFARMTRGQVLSIKSTEYVEAAKWRGSVTSASSSATFCPTAWGSSSSKRPWQSAGPSCRQRVWPTWAWV